MATMAGTVDMGRNLAVRPHSDEVGTVSVTKNVMLFLAAPWIGLAYIIVLPLVGAVAVVKMALRTMI